MKIIIGRKREGERTMYECTEYMEGQWRLKVNLNCCDRPYNWCECVKSGRLKWFSLLAVRTAVIYYAFFTKRKTLFCVISVPVCLSARSWPSNSSKTLGQIFFKFDIGDFKLYGNSDFQPYGFVIKLTLRKTITGIFLLAHKPSGTPFKNSTLKIFTRKCRNFRVFRPDSRLYKV